MERDGSMFYQTAVMKRNHFFSSWDASFKTLKSFTMKLIQFHPNMRNLTESDVNDIINTESWQTLTDFLADRYSERFQFTNYYGYELLKLRHFD